MDPTQTLIDLVAAILSGSDSRVQERTLDAEIAAKLQRESQDDDDCVQCVCGKAPR